MSAYLDSLSSGKTYSSTSFASNKLNLNSTPEQTDPMLKNENYQVMLVQDTKPKPLIVLGSVPEEFQISQEVDWGTPWGAGLGGSGMLGDLLAVTGNRLVGQVMTMKVWQGDKGSVSFTVDFEFRTWKDPVADIVTPIQSLMKMSMPSLTAAGFMTSPGPILTAKGVEQLVNTIGGKVVTAGQNIKNDFENNKTQNGLGAAVMAVPKNVSDNLANTGLFRKDDVENALENKISIRIGKWFKLSNIVITGVQHHFRPQVVDAVNGVFHSASVQVSFAPMFALTAEDIPSLISAQNVSSSEISASISGATNSGNVSGIVSGSFSNAQVASGTGNVLNQARSIMKA
jgi:hypothetical protein